MRDYTQPHPDAIFKDKPTYFIEVFKKRDTVFNSLAIYSIYRMDGVLECTKSSLISKTIALFIIKPKKP